MIRKKIKSHLILLCQLIVFNPVFMLLFLPISECVQKEALLFKVSPATVKLLHLPYRSLFDHGSSNYHHRFKSIESVPPKEPVIEEYFKIEPSDAIDGIKYSQPDVDYHPEKSFPDSVPSNTVYKDKHLASALHNPSQSNSHEQVHPSQKKIQNSTMEDTQFLESASNINLHLSDGISKFKDSIQHDLHNTSQSETDLNVSSVTVLPMESDSSTDLIPHLHSLHSPSDVLSYGNPPSSVNINSHNYLIPVKKSSERAIEDEPSHTDNPKYIYPDSNTSILSSMAPEVITRPPFFSNSHLNEITNQTVSLDSGETTMVHSTYDVENISTSSISFPSDNSKLSPGTVAGIVIGVLVCATILSSAVIYFLYQKYNGKCTSVVDGKFNSDNCGYLDDSLRSSIYLNNHIELPKESSEEMSSLDNDSFLNSLETMTIQNYWADNSKNTKV